MSLRPAPSGVTDRERWIGFFDAVEAAVVSMTPDQPIPMIVPPHDAGPIPADLAERARGVLALIDQAQRVVDASIEEAWQQSARLDRGHRREPSVTSAAFDLLA